MNVNEYLKIIDETIQNGRFKDTWESLSQYEIPEWYQNAKFGIFIHWGVYSVPAHGLSYTEFEYSNLSISGANSNEICIDVELEIKNIGTKSGAEIVQLYVSDSQASLPRPEKELKDFVKVYLLPQESKKVSFALYKQDFMYYNNEWVFEAGEFVIMLGSSSRDIRLLGRVMLH